VYFRLPADQANNYDQLKAALLKRYQLSADGFKRRFRTAKPESGETPTQFLTRIDNYLQRWIELAKAEKSFKRLKTLMVQEQYFGICSKEMAMHLKEKKPKTIQELGEKAKNYVQAHASDIVFGVEPKSSSTRSLRLDTRQCHNCGEVEHIRNQCLKPSSSWSVKNFNTSVLPQPSPRQKRQLQQSSLGSERQCRICNGFGYLPHQCPNLLFPRGIRRSVNVATSQPFKSPGRAQQPPRSSLRCFLCNRIKHLARDCLVKPKVAVLGAGLRCHTCGKPEHHARNCFAKPISTAAMLREKEERIRKLQDECTELAAILDEPEYEIEEPLEMEETEVKAAACQPTHHCQALIAVCQDCGLHHPVVADVCLLQDQTCQMPVANGTVEGTPVRVLRDTGCPTVVVRRSLVPNEKFTGLEKRCILIDGTTRQTPVAEIKVETLYFTGTVLAVCMENPICDLVVGNILGAMDPLYNSGKKVYQQTGANRRGQRSFKKGRPRRNSQNRRQADLNLREPFSESATVRPKLKLAPRTVKNPVNAVVHTERNASIFGTGKPRGSPLVIKNPYCQSCFPYLHT